MHKKIFALAAALLGTLLLLCSCGSMNSRTVSKSGFYFDTIISIKLYGTSDEKPIDECFALASRYENLFSNTIKSSEISQINQAAGDGEWISVSDETLELIEAGISYGKLSEGRFDITIGKLSDLWNFSEISANLTTENNETDASVLPSPKDVFKALSGVDYRKIEVKDHMVRLTDADVMIDLGGIAKGYIADQMKKYLVDAGIKSGIINLGGNVMVIGNKPDQSAYNVGIQKPFDDQNVIGVVSVSDCTCVTSGVYERYYRIDGKLYHHILDLSTGYPCDNNLYSVTIITDSSMDADALSTLCFALGCEDGLALIENTEGTEAIFVTDDMKCHTTSGIGKKITFRQ